MLTFHKAVLAGFTSPTLMQNWKYRIVSVDDQLVARLVVMALSVFHLFFVFLIVSATIHGQSWQIPTFGLIAILVYGFFPVREAFFPKSARNFLASCKKLSDALYPELGRSGGYATLEELQHASHITLLVAAKRVMDLEGNNERGAEHAEAMRSLNDLHRLFGKFELNQHHEVARYYQEARENFNPPLLLDESLPQGRPIFYPRKV